MSNVDQLLLTETFSIFAFGLWKSRHLSPETIKKNCANIGLIGRIILKKSFKEYLVKNGLYKPTYDECMDSTIKTTLFNISRLNIDQIKALSNGDDRGFDSRGGF
jgi:hypothetical protein